jgi:polysaccharide pyruvyl transferase WcaK-like protein
MKKKQILITGYYNKKNIGDKIFHYMAVKYFANNVNYEIKIVPSNVLDKYKTSIASSTDCIILFGGETLNEYFLKPISEIKQINQSIKIYGFGLNIGQNIHEIKQYLLMFQYIVCRHTNDINLLNNNLPVIKCIHMDDIAFAYHMQGYRKILNKKSIGFFLSQPKYYSMNEQQRTDYINKIVCIIKQYVSRRYNVKLFSMCYNNIISESDIVVNNVILEHLDNNTKAKVFIIDNDNFYNELLHI